MLRERICLLADYFLSDYTPGFCHPGPGSSKLTTSLVNMSLKFQTLISPVPQYFWLKKNVKSFCIALQKLFSFFQQKLSVYLVIMS